MYNLFKAFGRKITVLFLTVLTVLSQMGGLNDLTISADNNFPASALGVVLTIDKVNSAAVPVGKLSTVPEILVEINPDFDALKAGDYEDTYIQIILPKGSVPGTMAPAKVATDGVDSYITAAVDDSNPAYTAVVLKITNIQVWTKNAIESSVSYTYRIPVDKLFPNVVTTANTPQVIKASYKGTQIPGSTLNIKSTKGNIRWTGEVSPNTFTETKTAANSNLWTVSDTSAHTVVVNRTGGTGGLDTISVTPPNLTAYPGGVEGITGITVVQTIRIPDWMTVVPSNIEIGTLYGENGNISTFTETNATTGAGYYTITWNIPTVALPDQEITTSRESASVYIKEFSYRADKVHVSGGSPTASGDTHALYVTVETAFSFAGIDGDFSQPNFGPSYWTHNVVNPYARDDYSSSLDLDLNLTTAPASVTGERRVEGGFNFTQEPNWTLMDAINESSSIAYETSGFGNKSGTSLDNFKIKQDLGIFSAGGDHADAYKRLYVTSIDVAETNRTTGKFVDVTIEFTNGTTYTFANWPEGTSISSTDLDTAGVTRLINGAVGNIKSVTFNYGTVPSNFALKNATDSNKVNTKVIPHYIEEGPGVVGGKTYVWEMLKEDWNAVVADGGGFFEFNDRINDVIDGTYRFAGMATVSFNPDYSSPVVDGKDIYPDPADPKDDGVIYYNAIPTTSVKKSLYDITKKSDTFKDYETGDTIEFIIALKNEDFRDLAGVRIKDMLSKEYIENGSWSNATWEIYDKTAADTVNVELGNLHDQIKGLTPYRSSTTPIGTEYFGIFSSGGSDPSDTNWTSVGDTWERRWEWFDATNLFKTGEMFVLKLTVKLEFKAGDPVKGSIENNFESWATYPGHGGGWFPLANGGVTQAIWNTANYLDVKIENIPTSPVDKTIAPGSENQFVITAEARSDAIPSESTKGDVIVTAVLPYGWTYLDVVSIDIHSDTNVIAIPTGDVFSSVKPGGSFTDWAGNTVSGISSTLVRWRFENVDLSKDRSDPNDPKDNKFVAVIKFRAKAPEYDIVNVSTTSAAGITGGYNTSSSGITSYHDRIYTSIAMEEHVRKSDGTYEPTLTAIKKYKNDGWDIHDALTKNTGDNKIVSIHGGTYDPGLIYYVNKGPYSTARNPYTVFYTYKAVQTFYNAKRLVYGEGLDAVPLYGFTDWDGTAVNDRLSYYADVLYKGKYIYPFLTLTTRNPLPSFSLEATGPIPYSYDISITNYNYNYSNAESRELVIDSVIFRAPDYYGKVTTVSVGGTVYTGFIDSEAGLLAEGFVSYIKFKEGATEKPITLAPGETLVVTVSGNIDPADFANSGKLDEFSEQRLNSSDSLPAYAAIVINKKYQEYYSYSTTTSGGMLTNGNISGTYRYVDNKTGATPFFRAYSGNDEKTFADFGVKYILWARSFAKATRAIVAPTIKISNEINIAAPGDPADWLPIGAATPINSGSSIKWTVTMGNLATMATKDITDGAGYIIVPENYVATNVICSDAGVVIDTSTPGVIKLSNVNLAKGDTMTVTFETIVPAASVLPDDSICRAFIVPKSGDRFNEIDVIVYSPSPNFPYGEYEDTLIDSANLPSGFSFKAGMKTFLRLDTYGGTGIGVGKRVTLIDPRFGTEQTTNSSNILKTHLGDDVIYSLSMLNGNSDSSNISEVVFVDTLPRDNDTYYANRDGELRGSTLPVFIYDEALDLTGDYSSLVEVQLVNVRGGGSPVTLVKDTDYTVGFSTNPLLDTAEFNAGGAAVSDFTDIAAFTAGSIDAVKHVRVEYLGILEPGWRIVVHIKAKVPTVEDLIALNGVGFFPIDMNNTIAVNSFAFANKVGTTRTFSNSNSVTIRAEVAELAVGTFVDKNNNGYYDTTELPVPAITTVKVTILGFDPSDVGRTLPTIVDEFTMATAKVRYYYDLDPNMVYEVIYTEGHDEVNNVYYWFRPFVGTPASGNIWSVIDSAGHYVIDPGTLVAGEIHFAFAGYRATGPLVRGYVWNDTNEDGIWDLGELPHDNVLVEIFRVTKDATTGELVLSTALDSTTTDANGYYEFDLLFERPTPIFNSVNTPIDVDDAFEIHVTMPTDRNTVSPQFALGPYSLVNPSFDNLKASLWRTVRDIERTVSYDGSVADDEGVIHYFFAPAHDLNIGLYLTQDPPVPPVPPVPPTPNTGDLDLTGISLAIVALAFSSVVYMLVERKRRRMTK